MTCILPEMESLNSLLVLPGPIAEWSGTGAQTNFISQACSTNASASLLLPNIKTTSRKSSTLGSLGLGSSAGDRDKNVCTESLFGK